MKKIAILTLILFGCDIEKDRQKTSTEMKERVLMDLHYIRDVRTNLCFAYMFQRTMAGNASVGGPALAAVPCEAVEEFIQDGMKRIWRAR